MLKALTCAVVDVGGLQLMLCVGLKCYCQLVFLCRFHKPWTASQQSDVEPLVYATQRQSTAISFHRVWRVVLRYCQLWFVTCYQQTWRCRQWQPITLYTLLMLLIMFDLIAAPMLLAVPAIYAKSCWLFVGVVYMVQCWYLYSWGIWLTRRRYASVCV